VRIRPGIARLPRHTASVLPPGLAHLKWAAAAGCSAPASWVDRAADQVQQDQWAEEEDERECLERAAYGGPGGRGEGVEGRGGEEQESEARVDIDQQEHKGGVEDDEKEHLECRPDEPGDRCECSAHRRALVLGTPPAA